MRRRCVAYRTHSVSSYLFLIQGVKTFDNVELKYLFEGNDYALGQSILSDNGLLVSLEQDKKFFSLHDMRLNEEMKGSKHSKQFDLPGAIYK